MFPFASVLLTLFIPFGQTFSPELTDLDVYGSMLVANDDLVVSITDRTYESFVVYRPYKSTDFCKININTITQTYIIRLAVPRDASAAPNVFFYQKAIIVNGIIGPVVVIRVQISMQNCSSSWIYRVLRRSVPNDYSVLGVDTTGNVLLQTYNIYTYMRDYQAHFQAQWYGNPWLDGSNFVPYTMDITYGGWGVIAGAVDVNGIYIPTLYLILFPSNVYNGSFHYVIINSWRVTFEYSWQNQRARQVSGSDDYDPKYGMSLSINNKGDILFGVQSMNTVFHLYVDPTNVTEFVFINSRINSVTIPSIGFGKNVGWLDNDTAVILVNDVSLDYTEWRSSKIEIYDLSYGKQLNNTQAPYSSFPSDDQPMFSRLTGRILLMVASYTGSVIFMDSIGSVYMILPSPSGYYSVTNVGNRFGTPSVYFSSIQNCAEGTYKQGTNLGKYLFDTCQICPEETYNSGSINGSIECLPCDTAQYFCPLGAVAEVPINYIQKISQATAFLKSKDASDFEDILLLNMFNTNFEMKCLTTTPFFWTVIMLGIGLIFLIIMGIIKLSGKCLSFQEKIESILRHFDFISEGERWMGGVLSFSLVVIIIFAALFTNSFLKQYPYEKSTGSDFTCDQTLRNSEFSSHMQLLGAAVPDNSKKIYNLLTTQKFTLTVLLLNTIVTTNITVKQTVGSITTKLPIETSLPTNACIAISCNLTTNIAIITFNISGSQRIGGISISVTGPSAVDDNNQVKELNFSNSFTMKNRTMSQEPYFNIELIQVINETKALSLNDVSQFSGLWIPVFNTDNDRNFHTMTGYRKYHKNFYTLVTININQAVYFIYNLEKPIIKTTAGIFKNILFASMCLEVFAFVFLFIKLAIAPIFRLIIRLIRSKGEESEDKDDDDDNESKKEEEEEEHESEDEMPKQIQLEPGTNEYYMPDVKI